MRKSYYTQVAKHFATFVRSKYFILIVALFVIGTILRFYKLYEFVTFLGDQGRDALVIKRILTFEHFPAIGAPTSVGQVYLGPFYYYFIAPWLLLFELNPVGLAVGVAFFSSLFILIYYACISELFDTTVALISTIFLTFSSVLIDLSRFSWNPNLLPLFSFLFIYVLIKAVKTGRSIFYISAGCLLSICIQLHYLTLFFVPATALIFIRLFIQKRHMVKRHFVQFTATLFLFSLPLFIFDIRHNFLNTKNFLFLFNASAKNEDNKLDILFASISDLFTFSLGTSLPVYAIYTIGILSVSYCLYILVKQKHAPSRYISLFFLTTIASFVFYSGDRHMHYYGFLYPLFYLLLGLFLATIARIFCTAKYLIFILLIGFIIQNVNNYPFIMGSSGNQIDRAKNVAKIIYDNVGSEKYRLTSLPERYDESTYRYFLEIWKKKPIEKDSTDYVRDMFVVCNNECKPIGDPQWDVAVFAPTAVTAQWKLDNTYIYKLTNRKI